MKLRKLNRNNFASQNVRLRAPARIPTMELLEDRRVLAAVSWTGGGDGSSWQDRANWSNGAVPTAADDVRIDVAANPLIEIVGRKAEVNSLIANERLALGTSLRVVDRAVVNDIDMNRGQLQADQLSIRGNATFQISSLAIGTLATLEESARFEFLSSANTLSGSFVNDGMVIFNGASVRQSNAGITNSKTGVLQFQDSSLSSGSLTNHGRITSAGKTSLTSTLDNLGAIEFRDGELSLGRGESSIGFDVPKDALLKFGGDFVFTGETSVVGGGSVAFVSGKQDFGKSKFAVEGPVSMVGSGSANFDADVEFSSLVVDRRGITGEGSIALLGKSSVNLARPMDIAGRLTIHDELAIQGSIVLADGGVVVEPDASVEVVDFESTLGAKIINRGNFTVRDAVLKIDSGQLTNAPGGTLNLDNASLQRGILLNESELVSTGESVVRSELQNRGDVKIAKGRLTVGEGSSISSIDIPVGTTLRIQAETFSIQGAAELTGTGTIELDRGTLQTDRTLNLRNGANLEGHGTVIGDVTNATGIVAPGTPNQRGTVSIEGNYIQETGGIFEVTLFDSGEFENDLLSVSKTAILNGNVSVVIADGFVPADGMKVSVLDAEALSQTVAVTSSNALGASFQSRVDGNTLQIVSGTGMLSGQADATRRLLNEALTIQKIELPQVEAALDRTTGALPFLPEDVGSLSGALSIGPAIASLANGILPFANVPVPGFAELKSQLEQLGYSVECVFGEDACGEDFLRLQATSTVELLPTSFDVDSWLGNPLEQFMDDASVTGSTSAGGRVEAALGIGVDAAGFYLASESELRSFITLGSHVAGSAGPFSIEADGSLSLSPTIEFHGMDANGDGRIRLEEFDFSALMADLGTVTGNLEVALEIASLDYVDAIPSQANTEHGGDPFRIVAAGSVQADVGRMDAGALNRISASWSGIAIANPDVDVNGTPDFTSDVLADNLRLFAVGQLRGSTNGLLDPLTDALNQLDMPGTETPLGDALQIQTSLAEFVEERVDVSVIGFDEIESWINSGELPSDAELIELTVDLGEFSLLPSAGLSIDVLPDAELSFDQAQLSGQIVFGMDLTGDQPYLRTSSAADSTALAANVAFSASTNALLLGDGLLQIDLPTATFSAGIEVAFDGGEDGKLRISELQRPDAIQVSIGSSPILEVQAESASIATATSIFTLGDDNAAGETSGITGTVDLQTGQVALSMRNLEASVGGILEATATSKGNAAAVEFFYDPEAAGDQPLFTVQELRATVPQLTSNGLTPAVTFSQFGIDHNGTPFVGSAAVEVPEGYRLDAGLASLLPVEINRIDIDFPNPSDIDQFDLIVEGNVLVPEIDSQLDELSQSNVTTTLRIGDDPADGSSFAALLSVESLSSGTISAATIGSLVQVGAGDERRTTVQAEPITLGIVGLELAEGLTVGGELRLEPFEDGSSGSEVTGFFDVLAVDSLLSSGNFVGLHLDVLPGSSVAFEESGASLNVDGRLQLDAGFTGTLGGFGVTEGAVRFSLSAETSTLAAAPFVQFDSFSTSINSVAAKEIVVEIGDLIRITGSDIAIVNNPAAGQPTGSINQVAIDVFAFGGWQSDLVTAEDVQVFSNRIEFNELSAKLAGTLSTGEFDLASLDNLEISILGLTVVTDSNPLNGGQFSVDDLSLGVDGIRITADRAEFLDGVATVEDLVASIGLNENEAPAIQLTAAHFEADLQDVVQLTSNDISISITNDPTADVLTVGDISGTIPALTGDSETFSVSGLAVRRDGTMRFLRDVGEASLNVAAFIDRFAIADVLPLTVESAEIRFNDQRDLTNFDLVLADVSLTDQFVDSLPFEPILLVGDPDDPATQNGEFDLTIAISALGGDSPQPILKDVEQITLGFENWDVGEVVFDGQIQLGGIDSNGQLIPVDGENDVSGYVEFDFEHPGGSVKPSDRANDPLVVNGGRLAIGGDFTAETDVSGARIELDIETGLAFELRLGELFRLQDISLNSSLVLAFESPGDLVPDVDFSLKEVAFGEFELNFGDLMTVGGAGSTFNLSPANGELIASFNNLGVLFPIFADDSSNAPPLGGSVSNLKIKTGGRFELDGVQITGDLLQGVMQWLPLQITEAGLDFGDDFFTTNDNGSQTVEDATDILFVLSGKANPLTIGEGESEISLPLYGDFQNLTVDVQKFLDGEFPITNIDSFTVGLEPFPLAENFTVGGEISLGLVEVTEGGTTRQSLYGSLQGEFDTPLFGGSAKLVISEVGPLFGELTVPLAIPLGPSGLILKDVRGGFRFGGDAIPAVNSPAELIETDRYVEFLAVPPTPEVGPELQRFLDAGIDFTWQQPFTIGVSGTVDSVLSPGVFQGDLSFGANLGSISEPTLKLLGTGEINVYGMPFGRAGVLLDFDGFADPKSPTFLAPKLDFAFRAPAPGNPLGFVLPAEVYLEGALRTNGMIEAPLVAVHHFIDVALTEIRDGVAESEFSIATAILDAMAAKLTPESRLSRRLFDDPSTSTNEAASQDVSGAMLGEAILAELPASFYKGASQVPELVELASLVLRDALQAIDGVDVRFGDLETTLSAFAVLLQEAVGSAGTTALAEFNPTLEISGALQPTIFGFPLGTPTDEGRLTVSKNGVAIGLTTSIKESLKRSAGLFGTDIAAGLTELLVGGPGFTDELTFDFSLDFPTDLFEEIFNGSEATDGLAALVDTINPFANWSASVGGTIKFLGFDIERVSGIIFAPQAEGDTTSLFATGVHNVGLSDNVSLTEGNTGTPGDKIPVFRQSQHDAMSQLGGVLLSRELNIPAILQDPVAVFAEIASTPLPDISEHLSTIDDGQVDLDDLNAVTEIKDLYSEYVNSVVASLTENSRAGAIQLYVPSPATLFDVDLLLNSDGSFNGNILQDYTEQIVELLDSAYLEGFADLKLMSIDVGGAELQGTLSGITARTQNDFLGGLNAEITFGTSILNSADLVSSFLSNPLVGEALDSLVLPQGLQIDTGTIPQFVAELVGDEIPFPVASLVAAVGTDTLFSQLGLPVDVFDATNANAAFELYSPGFDFDAPHPTADPNSIHFDENEAPVKETDDIKRYGGARFGAELNMPGLVDDARFLFEIETPFVDLESIGFPEFTAYASAERIGLPATDLLELNEPTLQLMSRENRLTLDVRADLNIRGDLFSSGVEGRLEVRPNGIIGNLNVESAIDLGPALRVDGSANVAIDTQEDGRFEVVVGSSDGSGDAKLELFPTSTGLRPFGVDAEGQLVFRVEDNKLLLDLDANTQLIVLNADVAEGIVDGTLQIDDRITGVFDGQLSVFPYSNLQTHVELDEYGCFSFESNGFPLSPFQIGECGATLSISEQISSLDSLLTLKLSDAAQREMDATLRIADGTTEREVTVRIPKNERIGSVRLPASFRARIADGTIAELDVSILSRQYQSEGIDLFRPSPPRFSPLPQTVEIVYPTIQVSIETNIATERIGDDLEGRVAENAEPIVVTFSATADSPVPAGSTITIGWSESLFANARVGEDYEVNAEAVTIRIGQQFSKSLTITPLDDATFEPNERLSLVWRIDDSPNPDSTYLQARQLGITLEDDDAELPTNALAFYSFDRTSFEFTTKDGSKVVEGCCFPELGPTHTDPRITATDFEQGSVFRTVFDGNIGPPILSVGPAELTALGIEKHDPVFSSFSQGAVEESWTDATSDTSFFEFAIRSKPGQTVPVTGIEFWERRVLENLPVELLVGSPEGGFLNGPTQWQVRSSRDEFSSVLAEGDALGGRFAHHVAPFTSPFTVAPREEVVFRIYGLRPSKDVDDIPWVIDNVALIGSDASPSPRTAEHVDRVVIAITNQSNDFDNDFDIDFDNDGRITNTDFDVLIDEILQVQRGDTNFDGKVDFADFLALSSNFGREAGWGSGNSNLDSRIDFADFLALADNFGTGSD